MSIIHYDLVEVFIYRSTLFTYFGADGDCSYLFLIETDGKVENRHFRYNLPVECRCSKKNIGNIRCIFLFCDSPFKSTSRLNRLSMPVLFSYQLSSWVCNIQHGFLELEVVREGIIFNDFLFGLWSDFILHLGDYVDTFMKKCGSDMTLESQCLLLLHEICGVYFIIALSSFKSDNWALGAVSM